MSEQNFFEKLQDAREIVKKSGSVAMSEDAQAHLMLVLKSAAESIVSQGELEDALLQDLLSRVDHEDPDQRLTKAEKIELLEILKKQKSSDMTGLLGVLKQHVVVQQNNFGGSLPLPSGGAARLEKDISHLSKEDVQKGKKLLNFLDKVKEISEAEAEEIFGTTPEQPQQ